MKIAKAMVVRLGWNLRWRGGDNEYFKSEKSNPEEFDTEYDNPDNFRVSDNDGQTDVAHDADVDDINTSALTDSLLLQIQIHQDAKKTPKKQQQPRKQMGQNPVKILPLWLTHFSPMSHFYTL